MFVWSKRGRYRGIKRERVSKRKRGEKRMKWRVRERSTQFGEGRINRPSNRGRFGLTLKLDELL